MAGFTVPGFEVDQLLSRGWGGELWSARGRATGRPVVLRRLAAADDLATHDRVRRAAARLVGVQHDHLVRLRGVLSVEGAVVLVHDHVAGTSLDALLAGHRPLAASEVVTLLVPLAQALAEVHACGLVHGCLSPASVLLADDGRPLLADTGVAALIEGGDPPLTPSEDVRDLAITGRAALGPGADAGPLGAVLSVAANGDAARRPTAAAFAAAVFDTGRATPIQHRPHASTRAPQSGVALPTPTPTPPLTPKPHASPRPRSHRRPSHSSPRRASRRWVAVLLGLLAAAAAAFGGLAWASVDHSAIGSDVAPDSRSSAYAETATSARWRSVLAALDARRASAFATVSAGRLSTVYAAGSPALRRDEARLADLVAAELHVEGLRLRPREVRVATSTPTRVVLAVVDALDPYDVRTGRGVLVAARPGREAASWRVTLVRSGADWRIYDVVAA